MELLVATSIILSASTYLFDFISNIIIAEKYGKYYFNFLRQDHNNNCNDVCKQGRSEMAGYFWAMMGILFCSHTLNVLIFKFKVHREDDPFKSAYFLPLIHLWRLLYLFWNTLSCKGIKDLRSPQVNGLYNILGVSFESMPILILQYSAYLALVKANVHLHETSIIFKVSMVASLLSTAYNGGSSIESISTNANSFSRQIEVSIISGMFTFFAGISRGLTYVNIVVHMRDFFQRNRSVRSKARFHLSDAIPPIFLVTNVGFYWLFYWLFQSKSPFFRGLHQLKKCLTSLVFACMSIIIGPLYPMVSEAREMNQLGTHTFEVRLLFIGVLHILVDIVVVCITYRMGTLRVPYLVVSSVSAAGYILCLGWYITIDAQCGPVMCTTNHEEEQNVATHRVQVDNTFNDELGKVDETEVADDKTSIKEEDDHAFSVSEDIIVNVYEEEGYITATASFASSIREALEDEMELSPR